MKLLSHLSQKASMGLTRLRTLRLQGCEIGKIGVKHLKQIVKLAGCSITDIDVSYNMLESSLVNEFCKVLVNPSRSQ